MNPNVGTESEVFHSNERVPFTEIVEGGSCSLGDGRGSHYV